MKQIRKRLTYANVMSSIAVFLVLGGATALAAGLAKNSVGSKQIKKNAVTTAKIKNEAVSTAKIQNGAVTGAKVNVGSLGTVPNATHAASATKADSATTAAKATNADNATNATNATNAVTAQNLAGLYFAVVESDGSFVRGSEGVSSEPAGGGSYRVFLPAGLNTKNCFFVGSLGGNDTGNAEEGEISLNPSGTANAIYITTFNSAGATTAKEFSVLARC